MRFCRVCGFPLAYGRYLEWTADGVIQGRDPARTRLVFMEVDEIRTLFSSVSEAIGLPVDPIVCRAEKEVGRRFISTLVPVSATRVPRRKLARPLFIARFFVHILADYMAAMGMGRARLLEYKPGLFVKVELTESHSLPLVIGDITGVVEYLDQAGMDASWTEPVAGPAVLNIVKVSESPGREERLGLEPPEYLPGKAAFNRCPRCSVPREVSDSLKFELERGVVRNAVTGAREVALPAQSFAAVFRELGSELGEDVHDLVEGIAQQYTRESSAVRRYAGEVDDGGVLELLSDFTWRGMANPTRVEKTDRGLEVTLENAFDAGMAAGRVAGLYEAAFGTRVRVSWVEERQGRLKVTMAKPVDQGRG
jgi:hypothetical protein